MGHDVGTNIRWPMRADEVRATSRRVALVAALAITVLALAGARSKTQARDRIASKAIARRVAALPPALGDHGALHMEMSPVRAGTAADSLKAARIATEVRVAIEKYRDTSVAVADGYKLFLPELKSQKVYHFTNNWLALQEAFRFDPTKPTSILYTKDSSGHFTLVGVMFTAPKRFGFDKLDARVPLSIARWHKHVNWCVPAKGDAERWLERKNGEPLFGPESATATKKACDALHGVFHENVFGWMLHANVNAGDSPAKIWGDEHAARDMHSGMKMDGM